MHGFARPRAVTARISVEQRRFPVAQVQQRAANRTRWRFAQWGTALVVVVVTAGCQTPAAPFDPFLAGRSTIPPPGTAVPAAAAPYYNTAPPTVTVPAPGATYTAPGAIPAAPPTLSVPPAGAGQLPRGISVPQSNKQPPGNGAQLAKWETSDNLTAATTRASASSGAKPSDKKGNESHDELANSGSDVADPGHNDGVVRASYEARSRETPIRIVEPAAQPRDATMTGEKPTAKTASQSAAAPSRSAPRFRKLPELTDFPPADGGINRFQKQ